MLSFCLPLCDIKEQVHRCSPSQNASYQQPTELQKLIQAPEAVFSKNLEVFQHQHLNKI